jgi:GSH-dependent disulfide-bond oxidoreductase
VASNPLPPGLLIERKWPIVHRDRLQLFSLPTPNGHKVAIALEELGVPYEAHRVTLSGDQHTPEFMSISPNGKIPAIIDPDGPEGKPVFMMESVAILLHLGRKTGKLLPQGAHAELEMLQWLCFQVGHIGPMFGQFGHFHVYAKEKCEHPYPVERYKNEARRLLGVLNRRLDGRDFVLGDYSIVDISIFPWVDCLEDFYRAADLLAMDEFRHVQAWRKRCNERPATARGKVVCSAPAS